MICKIVLGIFNSAKIGIDNSWPWFQMDTGCFHNRQQPRWDKELFTKREVNKNFLQRKEDAKELFTNKRRSQKNVSQKETKNFCSGVGLRPSSSDERIDSSMFVLEVFLFYFFLTGFWERAHIHWTLRYRGEKLSSIECPFFLAIHCWIFLLGWEHR